jgi:hypothetical protein
MNKFMGSIKVAKINLCDNKGGKQLTISVSDSGFSPATGMYGLTDMEVLQEMRLVCFKDYQTCSRQIPVIFNKNVVQHVTQVSPAPFASKLHMGF